MSLILPNNLSRVMIIKKIVSTLLVASLAISFVKSQDEKGSHAPTPIKEMVVFYSQNHFQGQRVKLPLGKIDPDKLTFRIRSAKIPNGKVLKLEGPHADSGQLICRQFTEDIHDLSLSFGEDADLDKIAYCSNQLRACRCETP